MQLERGMEQQRSPGQRAGQLHRQLHRHHPGSWGCAGLVTSTSVLRPDSLLTATLPCFNVGKLLQRDERLVLTSTEQVCWISWKKGDSCCHGVLEHRSGDTPACSRQHTPHSTRMLKQNWSKRGCSAPPSPLLSKGSAAAQTRRKFIIPKAFWCFPTLNCLILGSDEHHCKEQEATAAPIRSV